MEIAATFIALVFTIYLYLTAVGYRCAVTAAQMVAKTLNRELSGGNTTIPQLMALPFVLWLSGLLALIRGEKKYIARAAEQYIDEPKMSGVDKRKIREAVREYRRKHSLF